MISSRGNLIHSNTNINRACRSQCFSFSLVPSKAPLNVQATSKDPGSIRVRWSSIPPGSVNGKLLGYKIYYKKACTSDVIKVLSASSTSTELSIRNLQLLTEYRIEVAGFTKKGVGVKSRPVYAKIGILLLFLLCFALLFSGVEDIYRYLI